MKLLPRIVFALYILILIKLILFKGPVFYEVVPTDDGYIDRSTESSLVAINLVPFRTIMNYFKSDSSPSVIFFNVFGNILLFIPYGFLLPFIFTSRVILFDVFYSALLLSLSFELFQLITLTGQFDIDDIILNTLGGITGYLLLLLARNLTTSKRKSRSRQTTPARRERTYRK